MTSIADVFTALGTVVTYIFTFFSDAISVITSNPLLFVPVLIGFAGSFILFAYKVIKSFQK